MDSAKVIMILSLFLTIKTIIGQPPNCNCATAGGSVCFNPGCSLGDNANCNDDAFGTDSRSFAVIYYNTPGTNNFYTGCNCPDSPYGSTHNAYYPAPPGSAVYGYNYDTCTTFGDNARDASGNVPAGTNDAINCCNYCCDRDDPYSIITTTAATITTATSGGREIILNKSLYLSSLTMLALVTLK